MIVYRLTQKNHKRLQNLSYWLQMAPDILLVKILEHQLNEMEMVKQETEFLTDKKRKYQLAETLELLEPLPSSLKTFENND